MLLPVGHYTGVVVPANPQKKTKAMMTAALRKLAATATCPKCGKRKKKEQFGMRVMGRDARGLPTRIARQSWCKECRH